MLASHNACLIEPLAIPETAVVSSTTAPGFRAANIGRDEIGLVWRSAADDTAPVLTIDLGADCPVDAILLLGLLGHAPAPLAVPAGWNWSVALATAAQGSFTGSFWQGAAEPVLAGAQMPTSGLAKALWFAPDDAPAAARYVRLAFTGLAGAAVQVSRAVIGQRIQLARNFRFGAAFGVRPLGSVDFARRGVMLRRRGIRQRGVGISFGHVHRDEVEAQVQPLLERLGNDQTLAVITDPQPDAARQTRIFFGFLTGDLGTVWARPGGFQADFNLIAVD